MKATLYFLLHMSCSIFIKFIPTYFAFLYVPLIMTYFPILISRYLLLVFEYLSYIRQTYHILLTILIHFLYYSKKYNFFNFNTSCLNSSLLRSSKTMMNINGDKNILI